MPPFIKLLTLPTLLALMFSLGLGLTLVDLASLWRQKSVLLRAILAVVIVPPLVALPITLVIPEADIALRAVLVAVAVAPGAPLTTRRIVMATKGDPALGASLQVTVSLLAVATTPLWIALYNVFFPLAIGADPLAVARIVASVQLLPIGAGILFQRLFPNLAKSCEPLAIKLSTALLVALILAVLANTYDLLLGAGIAPILILLPVVIVWLALGHFLGGGSSEYRATLAIGSIARNIGLALFLLDTNLLPERMETALPILLIFLLVGAIVGAVYSVLVKRSLPMPATE